MNAPRSPTRPALALRIGITGARSLDAAQLPRLSDQLQDILSTARRAMQDLAARDRRMTAAYDHATGAIPVPSLRLVSRGPETNRSYETVGRYVVRHSDVLIAIWDGGPGGRGGTAEIVRYAAHAGVPVWWLHATEKRAPIWIADIQDLRYPRAAAEQAETSLLAYLAALIPPPAPCHRHRHGIPGRLSQLGQGRHVSPEDEYFTEREQKRRWPWRAYAIPICTYTGECFTVAVAR
jgi:hypothetical protein